MVRSPLPCLILTPSEKPQLTHPRLLRRCLLRSDVETAAAAVRTLSGRPLPPPYNRALTITFQTDASSSPSVTGDDPRTLLVNPPRGREMERGTMATDAITQTLAAVPAGQLEEVLGRMKVRLCPLPFPRPFLSSSLPFLPLPPPHPSLSDRVGLTGDWWEHPGFDPKLTPRGPPDPHSPPPARLRAVSSDANDGLG